MSWYSLLRPALFRLPPEMAHHAALYALRSGLIPRAAYVPDARLATQLWGIDFPSPLGLAAGFDKNALAVDALLAQGFGFVEAGTVTPQAQPGNPPPRLFRLEEDSAIINRLGFNNGGLEAFIVALQRRGRHGGIVGANIGKNKDSTDAIADYTTCLRRVLPYVNYVTVNISSPNTQGLRALQQREPLHELLSALLQTRSDMGSTTPLLVKIAPDLNEAELAAVAEVVMSLTLDGIIISNTTLARPSQLRNHYRNEPGGLSGVPLFAPSTELLRRFYRLTQGKIPIVGVGGIASGEDAYAKIRAGASLIQLYTAFIYQGPSVAVEIQTRLAQLLARDGFVRIAEAVGVDC